MFMKYTRQQVSILLCNFFVRKCFAQLFFRKNVTREKLTLFYPRRKAIALARQMKNKLNKILKPEDKRTVELVKMNEYAFFKNHFSFNKMIAL